jgi:hypothetical protein
MKTPTEFPLLPVGFAFGLAEEPILLDGMKVLFDQRVGLYPVNLEKVEDEDSDE